jgi:hypothetical protein
VFWGGVEGVRRERGKEEGRKRINTMEITPPLLVQKAIQE